MGLADLGSDALYHLTLPTEWAAYQATGHIEPPSIAAEGFVHCSWGHQVAGTVARFFAGVDDLLALHLDPAALAPARLVEEDSYGSGQAFPHLYGEVPSDAVIGIVAIDRGRHRPVGVRATAVKPAVPGSRSRGRGPR